MAFSISHIVWKTLLGDGMSTFYVPFELKFVLRRDGEEMQNLEIALTMTTDSKSIIKVILKVWTTPVIV